MKLPAPGWSLPMGIIVVTVTDIPFALDTPKLFPRRFSQRLAHNAEDGNGKSLRQDSANNSSAPANIDCIFASPWPEADAA